MPALSTSSLYIERLTAGWSAAGIERDLLDPRLSLAQQILAAALEHLATFVNGNRFLKRHLALFEAFDDRFEFFDRPFEGHMPDIAVVFLCHRALRLI
jgi:hypothetical protein